MSLAEALLAEDAGKVKKRATKDVEVKRLSELFGVPFILHLRQLSMKRGVELANLCTKEINGKKETDRYELTMLYLTESITNPEFANKDVLKHYGVASRKELFETFFNAGEINDLYKTISTLSGLSEDDKNKTIIEVKN